MSELMKKTLTAAIVAVTMLAIYFCAPNAKAATPQPAPVAAVVHLHGHMPIVTNYAAHVGENVLFTTDLMKQHEIPVLSITLNQAGSMDEVDPRAVYSRQLRLSLGDEEGVTKAFQTTKAGTFTVSVNYGAGQGYYAGMPAKTETVTIVVK